MRSFGRVKQRHTAKRIFERLRDEHGFSGGYRLRGVEGAGSMSGAVDGEVMISSGPFASDDTATTSAMSTLRISDGNPVIIIRYDFGNVVTDDYCARVGN